MLDVGMFGRLLTATMLLGLIEPGGSATAASLSEPGRQPGEVERIQMHGNRLRGVHYLPGWQAGSTPEPVQFTLTPTLGIALDGDPAINVGGNVYPIDPDGSGRFGFVHFNGYRLMRAYAWTGAKLWEVANPAGRVHRSLGHRDTLAILDADGDGGQDIVHCWRDPGAKIKSLVLRDGATGEVLKKVPLAGQPATEECHIAAFRVAGDAGPLVLVAGRAPASAKCKGNYVDTFSHVMAFRPDLTRLWERATCNAGHYAWPLDADDDGRAEGVFVGKYLLRPNGSLYCTLPGFGTDHVDSMTVADLDPSLPGHEVLTVGATGTRFYSAGDCRQRWAVAPKSISNAQQTSAVPLAGAKGPATGVLVTTKLNSTSSGRADLPLRAYTLDAKGKIVGFYTELVEQFAAPIQAANLDGAPQQEDRLMNFGQVVDDAGRRRLTTGWYWGLQDLTPAEQKLDPREKWASNPFAFDLDNDGRDELIVWGRRKLVVGTRK
jgi:hypothetical protein